MAAAALMGREFATASNYLCRALVWEVNRFSGVKVFLGAGLMGVGCLFLGDPRGGGFRWF